jgi:hypothetical protein
MNMDSVFTLFAQMAPPPENGLQITDIVVVPGVIWAFGIAVWFFAAVGRRNGKVQRWKWFLAYGIVIFAAYAGWSGLGSDADKSQGFGAYIMDVASRSQYDYKRLVVAVWAMFVGPVLSIPVMWYFDRRESRHMAELVR